MIERKVFDEDAETIREISESTGLGYGAVQRLVAANTKNGVWERVWKKGSRWPVPAYRPAKKRRR